MLNLLNMYQMDGKSITLIVIAVVVIILTIVWGVFSGKKETHADEKNKSENIIPDISKAIDATEIRNSDDKKEEISNETTESENNTESLTETEKKAPKEEKDKAEKNKDN